MSDTQTRKRLKKRVWALASFDLEGIVGALAAFVVGLLLGWIWDPLFWLGLASAGLILLATRSQARTPPDLANIVVAPCDGVVHSIARALPPTELRLEGGQRLRLRISSSPLATNPIHACLTGEIESVIVEEPDRSVLVASQGDTPGLAVAHVTLTSLGQNVGITVSTGGFGPRLEVTSEAGDPVRLGRVIGKRRLGGWCDVYLPFEAKLLVREGQTLIGAETVLCRLLRTANDAPILPEFEDDFETLEDIGVKPSATANPVTKPDVTADKDTDSRAGKRQSAAETVESDDPEDAVAKLFKKLTDNEGGEL